MTSSTAATSGTAAPLEFRDVTKRYSGTKSSAVEGLSLTVPAGEICVLVGPSGCGKTTAMRLVNRMIELTSGDILIDGATVLGRDPSDLRREIGYVIQQIGLFPHLSITHNIGVVPKLLGWDKDRIEKRSAELLELVGLPTEMGDRFPTQLSGGQRQRVGVARALAADPPLMLMDEPFGAIDPINRDHLQNEFLRLQTAIRKTVVFVTHDIDEAIKMGDRIAILREGGELVQYDTPSEILAHPADDFVARFVGVDRGLKRLALTKLADIDLIGAPCVKQGEAIDGSRDRLTDTIGVVLVDDDGRPLGVVSPDRLGNGSVSRSDSRHIDQTVTTAITMREALSLMMTDSLRPMLVVDGDGKVAGYVSIELINRALHDEAAHARREPVTEAR
ncbi:MAG: ABC transporter ATP-binding protein [Actinomycetota bacterium]|nr:ABC transporter ATP-binding protein [Actinomycetota bacterium]